MNKVLLAAVAALGLTTAAQAADINYFAGLEYATEAEVLETTVGAGLTFDAPYLGSLTVAPAATFNDEGTEFGFASAEVSVMYNVTAWSTAYVTVESDNDWNHAETTVGVAFNF
jgi:hypothetical protein